MKMYGEVEEQLHASLISALYFRRNRPQNLLYVKWCGPQGRSRFCDEGKLFCVSWDSNPDFPVVHSFT
jgi:hypothetical protein